MSTDPSGAAVARDDTAVAGSLPQARAIPPRDLAELAAAVDRLEALITAAAGSNPNGSDAIERIADIAFVLHERDVEASLCDALDAAVRDLGDVDPRVQENAERLRQAAELLGDLSQRINDIITRTLAGPPSDAESMAGLEPEPSDERAGEDPVIEEMMGAEPTLTVPFAEPSLPVDDGVAVECKSPAAHAANVAIGQLQIRDGAEHGIESGYDVHSPGEGRQQAEADAIRPEPEQTLSDPEDDPGDLFEPPSSPLAAPFEMGAPVTSPLQPDHPPGPLARAGHGIIPPDQNAPLSPSPKSQRPDVGASALAISNDPLAAVRALSEEEMIALFS